MATIWQQPWADVELEPSVRANLIASEMSLDEKLVMLHGFRPENYDQNKNYTGYVVGNERLGIPSLRMLDGPQGVRTAPIAYENRRLQRGGDEVIGSSGSTAWPSALTVAASWDRDLIETWTGAMAIEFAGKGANVALAPGVNVARAPLCGRNFEYLSGEDPYLGAELVRPYIRGLQSRGTTLPSFISSPFVSSFSSFLHPTQASLPT
jgi:beta-glucosidase